MDRRKDVSGEVVVKVHIVFFHLDFLDHFLRKIHKRFQWFFADFFQCALLVESQGDPPTTPTCHDQLSNREQKTLHERSCAQSRKKELFENDPVDVLSTRSFFQIFDLGRNPTRADFCRKLPFLPLSPQLPTKCFVRARVATLPPDWQTNFALPPLDSVWFELWRNRTQLQAHKRKKLFLLYSSSFFAFSERIEPPNYSTNNKTQNDYPDKANSKRNHRTENISQHECLPPKKSEYVNQVDPDTQVRTVFHK